MKTFQEFCSQLDESSLSRIKSKSDKGGMAVISGSRGDKSKKAQGKLSKALAKELQVALHIKQCQFAKKEMSSGRKTKQQANN